MALKKKLLTILSFVLIFSTVFSLTASAKSSQSFNHWDTMGENLTVIGRSMYEPIGTISAGAIGNYDSLEGITDIYCKDEFVYILCGESSKLYVLNKDYSFNREISILDANGEVVDFFGAAGVYVDEENLIYISSTQNGQILIVDQLGKLLKTIDAPKADVIPEDFIFQPTSILKDTDGNFYVVSTGSYYGALLFTPNFEFEGFFGANAVEHSVLDVISFIWDKLTNTDAKRAKQTRVLPYAFSDMAIDNAGFLYTCTGATSSLATNNGTGQIQMLSPSGSNILLSRNNHGETSPATGFNFLEDRVVVTWEKHKVQNFCAISVDDNGLIYSLDQTYGLIYVYDSECNLVTAFGGGAEEGNQRGQFKNANCLAINGNQILVGDSERNTITVFQQNDYGKMVSEAMQLTASGQYQEAAAIWEECIAKDRNFLFAYRGLAKAYYAVGDFEKAKEYAEISYDFVTYDAAHQQIMKKFFEENFAIVFVLVVILICLAAWFLVKAKKKEKRKIKNKKLATMLDIWLHPFKAFGDIKNKKTGSIRISVILVFLFIFTSILKYTGSAFLFRTADVYSYNSLYTLASTGGLVLLWIIANWLVGTIMSGKGTLSEITQATAYSLQPMILANVLVTALSYILTYNDVALINGISLVATIFTFALIIVGNMNIHDYSLSRFLLTTVVTVFLMIVIVFILFMVVIMFQQLFNFIYAVYMEVVYR